MKKFVAELLLHWVVLTDIRRPPLVRLYRARMQIAFKFSFVQIFGRSLPAVFLPRLIAR